MPGIATIGLQWGDEGKGHVVDELMKLLGVDVGCRFNGGANAGHTIFTRQHGKIVLHLVPTTILHPRATCILGNGMVFSLSGLIEEIQTLQQKGIKTQGVETASRIFVSERAHLILPNHQRWEKVMEERWGGSQIGTTQRGIGPTYMTKASRSGLRLIDLTNPKSLEDKLRQLVSEIEVNGGQTVDVKKLQSDCLSEVEKLWTLATIVNASAMVNCLLKQGKTVIFEGAQGTMLDIDHGTYPFVTSSSATIGGVCTGLGIGPYQIDEVIGVMKAYTTRVGYGPFPSELFGKTGEALQKYGNEFGATTGRPRRCGWLDLVALRYAVQVNGGIDAIALTKLDVYDKAGITAPQVCVAYDRNGYRITEFPADTENLRTCRPILEEWPGWSTNISAARSFGDLPDGAQRFIGRLEDTLEVPIRLISVGARRGQTIWRE